MKKTNNKLNDQQPTTGVSINRRILLKAGWILPVIAVTPLVNTASAISTVDCDALLEKRDYHRKNHDKEAYNDIQAKLDANGCPC